MHDCYYVLQFYQDWEVTHYLKEFLPLQVIFFFSNNLLTLFSFFLLVMVIDIIDTLHIFMKWAKTNPETKKITRIVMTSYFLSNHNELYIFQ